MKLLFHERTYDGLIAQEVVSPSFKMMTVSDWASLVDGEQFDIEDEGDLRWAKSPNGMRL